MKFEDYSRNYLDATTKLIASVPIKDLEKSVEIIKKAYRHGKKIFLMGNGGSASTAAHITCDLSKCTIKEGRPRLKVLCLSNNISLITAWANDTEYDNIFSEQLLNIIEKGDVVIAFSGSGNSPNIIRAVETANDVGAITIGLSGFKGGRLIQFAKHCIIVNSDNMQQIEDLHLIISHILFSFIRDEVVV